VIEQSGGIGPSRSLVLVHTDDTHGCIMVKVRTRPTGYKAAARSFAPERELPSDTLATSLGLFTGRRRLTRAGRSTPACGHAADIEATSKRSPPLTERA
jgi:hypothetical protein